MVNFFWQMVHILLGWVQKFLFSNFSDILMGILQNYFAKIYYFNFAKFKIISFKFRVSQNLRNAVSQPPYMILYNLMVLIHPDTCLFQKMYKLRPTEWQQQGEKVKSPWPQDEQRWSNMATVRGLAKPVPTGSRHQLRSLSSGTSRWRQHVEQICLVRRSQHSLAKC